MFAAFHQGRAREYHTSLIHHLAHTSIALIKFKIIDEQLRAFVRPNQIPTPHALAIWNETSVSDGKSHKAYYVLIGFHKLYVQMMVTAVNLCIVPQRCHDAEDFAAVPVERQLERALPAALLSVD